MKIDGSGQRKTQRGVCFRTRGKCAEPIGFKLSRGKAFLWPVFGTESRPTGAPGASRRDEEGLLAGLRHGYPAHRCSRGILAWRRGSSFRPLARLPCPQVPNCYPRGVYKRSADGQQRSADATSGQRKFSQRMPAAAGQLTASSFRPGEVRGDSARGRTRAARQRPGAVRQRNMADWERRRRGGKIFSLFCQATSSPESGHIPPEQKNTYL